MLLLGQNLGTFRDTNPAFVTSLTALEVFWSLDALSQQVQVYAAPVRQRLKTWQARWPNAMGVACFRAWSFSGRGWRPMCGERHLRRA